MAASEDGFGLDDLERMYETAAATPTEVQADIVVVVNPERKGPLLFCPLCGQSWPGITPGASISCTCGATVKVLMSMRGQLAGAGQLSDVAHAATQDGVMAQPARELTPEESRAYEFYRLERDAGLRVPSPAEMTRIHFPDLDESFFVWLDMQ